MIAHDLTPIRTLMNLRHIAHQRNVAVEAASSGETYLTEDWAVSSRIWSRQIEALTLAVIAEPPKNLEDVLSTLCCPFGNTRSAQRAWKRVRFPRSGHH